MITVVYLYLRYRLDGFTFVQIEPIGSMAALVIWMQFSHASKVVSFSLVLQIDPSTIERRNL
jgi:hypothetical protein